jgi:hypothetical protein
VRAIFINPDRKGPLHLHSDLTGEKVGVVSKEFKFSQLRAVSKKLGCTFNDLVLGIFMTSMAKIYQKLGDTKNKEVFTMIPFSGRANGDFTLRNDVLGIPMNLRLVEDLRVSIQT